MPAIDLQRKVHLMSKSDIYGFVKHDIKGFFGHHLATLRQNLMIF